MLPCAHFLYIRYDDGLSEISWLIGLAGQFLVLLGIMQFGLSKQKHVGYGIIGFSMMWAGGMLIPVTDMMQNSLGWASIRIRLLDLISPLEFYGLLVMLLGWAISIGNFRRGFSTYLRVILTGIGLALMWPEFGHEVSWCIELTRKYGATRLDVYLTRNFMVAAASTSGLVLASIVTLCLAILVFARRRPAPPVQ